MKTVVIIGGVAGGASCAARLRRLDQNCEIILLERGKYISYANCGLPYHIGNVIKSGRALLLETPELMKKRYNIDVRVEHEALSIDPASRSVEVLDKNSGEQYKVSYDSLVLATGSSPVKPPIPGIESSRIFSLWRMDDAFDIRRRMKDSPLKSAVVIGGGFIGLEVAENLCAGGFKVSLVEMLDQVFAPFDPEMAGVVHSWLEENGIDLHLSEGVTGFSETEDGLEVSLKSGEVISCGLAVVCAGVAPNNTLAKSAGLELNPRGTIKVNEHLQTSDPYIYAVGDVIADSTAPERQLAPLAGPANKQGRIVAGNIAGRDETYDGSSGSSVVKLFGYTVAATGASEKVLKARSLEKGRDYETVLITQNDHASYYPDAKPMFIKLIFSIDGSVIYGAQIAGMDGVDKRIDDIGIAIKLGAGIHDIERLDLAYSPPYSSAKDPVNMAGFTAANVLDGLVSFCEWDEPIKNPNTVILDIREKIEQRAFTMPDALRIPLGDLRERIPELDKNAEYIIFCSIGVRSYNAARLLSENGFEQVKVYPGGVSFYRFMKNKQ